MTPRTDSPGNPATNNGDPPREVSGWGRYPVFGREVRSDNLEALTRDAVLCRGLGRSYGDSSLPPPSHPEVVATPMADRILAFDPDTTVMRAEAGLSLADLNRNFLARGFFTPVSPGTQFVTLGGMVAADVHGKNHHQKGCFGRHVRALRMRVADGRILECSREQHEDLFLATIGGMGLTGHILEVEFTLEKLPSPWIWSESERIRDIDAFLDGLQEATKWPYTVGWIDCVSRGKKMGRGILMKGRWATADEAPSKPPPPKRRFAVPFECPSWCISPFTVRLFNSLYYHKHIPREKQGIVHPETFFYPLDVVRHWNLVYGRRGMTQYQCVLPKTGGHGAARRFMDLLTSTGCASMLAVIKDCGPEGDGRLSFPKPGISIALDFPIRDDTQDVVNRLNELVIREGGRIYLAKDAFTRADHFRSMEPRLDEFLRTRRKWDPEGRLKSAQSVRIFGDEP